jgi:hypothetical protein
LEPYDGHWKLWTGHIFKSGYNQNDFLGSKLCFFTLQKLVNKKNGSFGRYEVDQDVFHLFLNGKTAISVPHDTHSSLPVGCVQNGEAPELQVNVTLIDDNQNFTKGQKLLLEWLNRVGHLNFPRIQQVLWHIPFITTKFATMVRCDPPECHTCQLANARRRPKKASLQTRMEERDGALKSGDLKVGSKFSVDHFESHILGKTYDSFDKPSSTQFVGGDLFIDNASGLIHCDHQLGFSAVETIRAEQSSERRCTDDGIIVQDYLTDTGAFKTNKFMPRVHETHQLL